MEHARANRGAAQSVSTNDHLAQLYKSKSPNIAMH